MLADKAYDSAELREELDERGTKPVIPNRSNRKQPYSFSKRLYKLRWRIDIDQSWRLSRLLCGWGGGGASRRSSPPWHRGCKDHLQGRDLGRTGIDEFGMRSTDLDNSAA